MMHIILHCSKISYFVMGAQSLDQKEQLTHKLIITYGTTLRIYVLSK